MENHNFIITESAKNRLEYLLSDKENGNLFRISVNGGGCSGFSYEFSFDNSTNEDDIIFESGNAKVAIDEISLPFLENAKLEWVDELLGSSFRIKNPNAKSSCGCGVSFSV